METFLQDARVTLRSFRRSPGFALTAIATLALGIGATTAIFTALSAVLLKPLPYPNPEQLYNLRTALTDGRVTTGMLSGAEIIRLNDPKLSIQYASGYSPFDLTMLAADETPTRKTVYGVNEHFFELFGLPMIQGGFTHDEFQPIAPPPPGAPPQQFAPPRAVISARLWREFYNSDPAIVGKAIRFAEFNTTIAGVAHKDFDVPHNADIWFANRTPADDPNHSQDGFMRIKPGASMDRVKSEMTQVMNGIAADFPNASKARIYLQKPMVESIVGDLGPILVIVMSATGLLLLLACVNVANLLLARGAARAREMAVRAALGAGYSRLVKQLLTESVVLAAVGTLVGLGVGALGLKTILAIGASKLPRLDEVGFDGRVLLFALVVLLVVGAIIGLAPAVRLMRSDMKTLMNDSSRSASAGRGTTRWLMAMTVAEVALAIMLVAGAGWLVRGFANLRNTDAGFVTTNRLIFDAGFFGDRYNSRDAVIQGHKDLVTAVKSVAGVTDAGLVSAFPMRGRLESSLLAQFHGEEFNTASPPGTRQRFSGEGLFTAMGTKLIKGRDFNSADVATGLQVAIVNQVFVDRYLKGRDPIGVQFSAGYPRPDPTQEVTIVGVVDNVRQKSLSDVAEPAYYVPLTQAPIRRLIAVVQMSPRADVAAVQRGIRAEIKKINPTMALDFELATEVVGSTLRRQELGMTLMVIFGVMAVLLAAVGIYGVVSYAGELRHDEMATRLALGASPGDVFKLVLKQGATLGLIGAGVGISLSFLTGQVIANKVYAIKASDPVILGAATLLITAITVGVTLIPARRAARLNPASALLSK
jgi:putative ABC transport system permease protein